MVNRDQASWFFFMHRDHLSSSMPPLQDSPKTLGTTHTGPLLRICSSCTCARAAVLSAPSCCTCVPRAADSRGSFLPLAMLDHAVVQMGLLPDHIASRISFPRIHTLLDST